jgi:uncharacterized protein (DUF1786 family)
MSAELDEDDMARVHALAAVIVAKVLDELAPRSETVTTSDLALGALACAIARAQLAETALNPPQS